MNVARYRDRITSREALLMSYLFPEESFEKACLDLNAHPWIFLEKGFGSFVVKKLLDTQYGQVELDRIRLIVLHDGESVNAKKVTVDSAAQFARQGHQPNGFDIYLLLEFCGYWRLGSVSKWLQRASRPYPCFHGLQIGLLHLGF